MFRGKTFQVTLPGNSYRIFIEGLKSPVTKAAYSYALQKYMHHLNVSNPDDLLIDQENPKTIQNQIINYLIKLKNPPQSLRYATRSQYLSAIMTFYELNDVALSKKKIYRYLGEEERPIENQGYSIEEISKMLDVCDERTRAIILVLASTKQTKELFMGHSIGLDDHYFTPEDTHILQEYLKAVDNLTINEENRLRIRVDELTKKKNEIETMELGHMEKIKVIHEQMNQMMTMIQRNPKLANIKPEVLIKKSN